ncbi:hypothetical protein [Rurimicrobium arvi]|uniref:TonB-dependent receptor n=1 Tax=Rurimicrobium arvi TaxID=2049916 RepID=A0ABP8MEW9_9BACT
MMNRKQLLSFGLLATAIPAAQAQTEADTTIRATRIEITQIYKPKVKQADKESLVPVLPPRSRTTPRFDYQVPQYSPAYTYKPSPLQPLALLNDSAGGGFRHYLKAGIGNRHSILLEGGTDILQGRYFNAQLFGGLLSQKSSLAYQQQLLADIDGKGTYRKGNTAADIDLNILHRNFYQYGYNHDAYPSKVPAKQTLSGAGLLLNVRHGNDTNNWAPEVRVRLSYYSGSRINNENTGGAGIFANRYFSSEQLRLSFGAEAVGTQVSTDTYSAGNSYAYLSAGAVYNSGDWTLRGFIRPAIGQHGNSWLLQDLSVKRQFRSSGTTLELGSIGAIQQNTYKDLFLTNPFISTFTTQQSHSNEFFINASQKIGKHISAEARGSFWKYENLASFLNGFPGEGEKMYTVYLPRVTAVSLQGSLRYQIADQISVGAQVYLFRYTKVSYDNKVWQTPNTRINGDLLWHPINKLSITAYMAYVGGNFAVDSTAITRKLKAYADVGVGAEWNIVKNISLFANVNNLLNNKYERWLGYQAYGINVIGGLRVKFK